MTSALQATAVAPAVSDGIELYGQLQAVRNALAPDLNDTELQLFALVARQSGLDPFARQIHAVKRGGKVSFQTGIDGYRSIAERTNEYDGSDVPGLRARCPGPPGMGRGHRLRWRRGERRPQTARAYWSEFYPGGTNPIWGKMPKNQLAKCAEALALRKAFPYVLANLYTDEEMAQADRVADEVAGPAPVTARDRLAARRAAVESRTTTEDGRPVDTSTGEIVTEGQFREEPSQAAAAAPGGAADTADGKAEVAGPLPVASAGTEPELDFGAVEGTGMAPDLAMRLAARTETAGDDQEAASEPLRKQLTTLLTGLGALPIRTVLRHVWNVDEKTITVAQANAILDEAEGKAPAVFRLDWSTFADRLIREQRAEAKS